MQNSLIAQQSKTKNQKTIVLVCLCLLVLICGYFLWQRTSSSPSTTVITDNSPIVDQPTIVLDSANLIAAKKILDHFSANRDPVSGFYGEWQICSDENNCQYNTSDYLNDSVTRTAFRSTVNIAWARFKFYEKTGDVEQLTELKKDLDNLTSQVINNDLFVLQTNTFNCLLMREIATSPLIDSDYQNKAKEICFNATFESVPDGNVDFDQHNHNVLVYYRTQVDPKNNLPVVNVKNLKHDPNELITFTNANLITQINQNLNNFLQENYASSSSKVTLDKQQNFMTREIIAAIDQTASLNLSQNTNPTIAAEAEAHYLILTAETLSWYVGNPTDFSALDQCLLQQNLTYYLNNYQHQFNDEQIITLQNKLDQNLNNKSDQIVCQIARQYLNPESKATDNFLDLINNNSPDNWTTGYAYLNQDNQVVFPLIDNALLTGLLIITE